MWHATIWLLSRVVCDFGDELMKLTQLILAAKAGDEGAMVSLLRKFDPLIRRLCQNGPNAEYED
jgi:hypothetical protein